MRISNKDIKTKMINPALKFDIRLIIVLFIYTLLSIIFINYYQFQINPDGINYINIAHSYMSGNFYGSINDYWSPLLSWLMIPFLYFGHTPVTALYSIKIMSLILGFLTIIGIKQLSYRFEMDEVIRTVILFTVIIPVLFFSLSIITPDLLIVCVLVYYLSIIFNFDYPSKLSNGAFCGILGALSYLSKSYGLLFFISTFLIFNILQYFRDSDKCRKKKIFKNFILGFTIFFVISGLWIGLISNADGKLTFGTAGASNYAEVAPPAQGFSNYNTGIYKPGQIPNFVPEQWSPISSWSNFKYQLSLIWYNTLKIGSILTYFSFLSILIIFSYIILYLKKPRDLISQTEIIYPLIALFVSAGGYVVILVEARYIWLINILLILMGGYLLNLLFKRNFFNNQHSTKIKTIILLIFAFSFIIFPMTNLIQNIHTGEDIYNISTVLNQQGVHGTVATNDKLIDMEDLKYYVNINLPNQSKLDINDPEFQNELKNNKINYYFVWGNNNNETLLSRYNSINNGNISNLRIYIINE
jgi:hypothetical protein